MALPATLDIHIMLI